MVRILIAMRATALGNARHSRFGILSLVAAVVVGLATASSTLWLGFTAAGGASGGADQLALVMLTWTAGRIGFAAFSGGDPGIALDLFRIIPVPRRRLARSLLVLGLVDPAMPFLAIAFSSLVAFGFRHGPIAGLVGIVGAGALLLLVGILSTIVAALVPTGSRRRQDLGALLAAALISAVVVAGTLVGPLLATLAAGSTPALSLILRVLPTGWAGDAIAAASLGQPGAAALLVAALLAANALCAAIWPQVLGARLVAEAGSGRHAHARASARILPATVTGAVTSREVRLWIRDPNRAGFLIIALVVGLGGCLVPLITHGAAQLLPFAGLGTALIAAAVAGNSYGFDGPALGLTLTVAGAERHDVRGRQLAWFIVVGPYAILLSIAGLLVSEQNWAWPWVLAMLPALLGGGVGVFPLISLLAVQPLDDNGSPGPTWVVKAYATIVAVAISAAPPIALLVIGIVSRLAPLTWIAVPVGVLTGVCCAVVLGRIAGNLLARRGPEVFQILAGAVAGR